MSAAPGASRGPLRTMNPSRGRWSLWILLCCTSCFACSQRADAPDQWTRDSISSNDTPDSSKLASVRVFFNHQSVGANVLSAAREMTTRGNGTWPIVEIGAEDRQWPPNPGLWHATLGENGKPKSKLDAFARALRTLSGKKPDVALMKLCFVDVTTSTDLADLAEYYRTTMASLKAEFPDVVFVHTTVPLAPHPESVKSKVKRLIGRRVVEDAENLARSKYNASIRALFPDDPWLDIARIESTHPDGTRVRFPMGDSESFALASEYASDPWGHLNALGSRRIANELLGIAANALPKRPTP